jgi:hypothetical protein
MNIIYGILIGILIGVLSYLVKIPMESCLWNGLIAFLISGLALGLRHRVGDNR